jgi:hypothetical protein
MNQPYRAPTKMPEVVEPAKPIAELRFFGNGCYVLMVAGREVAALRMYSHEADVMRKMIRDAGGRAD